MVALSLRRASTAAAILAVGNILPTVYVCETATFFFSSSLPPTEAFSQHHQRNPAASSVSTTRTSRTRSAAPLPHFQKQQSQLCATVYDDFEGFFFPPENRKNNNNGDGDEGSSSSFPSDADLYASLRARQASLEQQQQQPSLSSSLYGPASSSPGLSTASEQDQGERERIRYNWKEANCVSTVRVALNDWIRRLAVDLYPLVVCGSARGHLYLADLEQTSTGKDSTTMGPLDCLKHVHASHLEESVDVNETPPDLNEALEVLYGNYDGGGVMAIAVKKDWIVSSGREGGVHVCSIVGAEEDVYTGSRGGTTRRTRLMLQPLGRMRGLEEETIPGSSSPPLITSLAFDDQGTLWVAGYDGVLRGYDYEQTDANDQPLMLRQTRADHTVNVNSPILSVSIRDEIGCGVMTTLSRGVLLFSLEDGHILAEWNPFVTSKRGEYARSAMIVQTDEPQPFEQEDDGNCNDSTETVVPSPHWSVVVGGSKGTLYQRCLGIHSRTGFISERTPLMDNTDGDDDSTMGTRIRPNHLGPIVAMDSPSPGLLVTGSHDGTMRVWDCSLYRTDEDEDDEDDDDDDEDDDDHAIDAIDADLMENLRTFQKLKSSSTSSSSSSKRPRVLYALSGYKVWLGSIFANDRKLVSDGADNSIIVHSFDEDEEDVLRSREGEEDEDDLEDFSFD